MSDKKLVYVFIIMFVSKYTKLERNHVRNSTFVLRGPTIPHPASSGPGAVISYLTCNIGLRLQEIEWSFKDMHRFSDGVLFSYH